MLNIKLIPNVSEIFYNKQGQIIDKKGDFNFFALNNYANLILLHFEDNDTPNEILFANFTPNNNYGTYTSHWFYINYQGLSERFVLEEQTPRTFSTYVLEVPNLILNNNYQDQNVINTLTVIRRSGFYNLGMFDTFAELNGEYQPTQSLMDKNAFAYVLNIERQGFYQVIRDIQDDQLKWVLRQDKMDYGYITKQYPTSQIIVQKGFTRTNNLPTYNESVYQAIAQTINRLEKRIATLTDLDLTFEETQTVETIINKITPTMYVFSSNVKIDNNENDLIGKTNDGLYIKHDDTKVDLSVFNNKVTDLEIKIVNKQNKLIAGDNITIVDDVISATGGSGGGYQPDEETIVLNDENKLKVSSNLEIDGGYL